MDLIGGIAMESGILMIVIVVIGVFYPVYTAWISLVAAPVYLKIGFLFAMAGALLVMRILRKEKQIKWIVLIGILGAYAWSLYSWYDEECHCYVCEKRAWRFGQCFDAVCWHLYMSDTVVFAGCRTDLVDGVPEEKERRES